MGETDKGVGIKRTLLISLLLAMNLIFLAPLAIGAFKLSNQASASLSAAEFLGIKSEPYDFNERAGIDPSARIDIIDAFVYGFDDGRINRTTYYAELERETLRMQGYPSPFYFYAPLGLIVIYLVIYWLVSRRIKMALHWKLAPFAVVAAICTAIYLTNYDPSSVIYVVQDNRY